MAGIGKYSCRRSACCCAWSVSVIGPRARRCRETLLLPLLALLVGLGLLFLLRLAGGAYPYLEAGNRAQLPTLGNYDKQLVSFGVGWMAMMAMILWWKDYRALARYKYLIAATAILLLC